MHSNKKLQKGLGLIGILLLVVAIGFICTTGYYVYSKNKNEPTKLNQVVEQKTYTVLAVGDIACDPNNPNFNSGNGQNGACMHKDVLEQMKKQNAEYALLLGDIQYLDGRLDAYEKSFVKAYKDYDTNIIAVPGNHDWYTGKIDGYLQTFNQYFPKSKASEAGRTYFDTKIGQWTVYALDSDCEYVGGCDEGSPQYEWLKQKLINDGAKCSLAIWHHPIFTGGAHKGDGGEKRAVQLYDLLQKNKVDFVVTGHDHNYQRFAKKLSDGRLSNDGMRSFISGGGGAELHKINQPLELGEEFATSGHGFLKLTLSNDGYSWSYININGESIDSGSDSCRN